MWAVWAPLVLLEFIGPTEKAPSLYTDNAHGLAKAAQATSAWVLTGGTDSGVMQLVGRALSEYDARVAVVGITPWGVVHGREKLENCTTPHRTPSGFSRIF